MSDNSAPEMDYAAHESTYEGFINFSKIGIIAVLNVVLCLILFAFGGTFATGVGWIVLIATLVSVAIGMAIGANGWVPSAAIFVLTGAFAILAI
ncbi:aa3-type cytochrome c oxidase subunit IV [Roseibium algae]|uniref:Aa3-type cytochrome c oxidase subunit IV n=1 Tax=Roseibium algae TaxID=3123038 RepID=A0ABU8TG05_9HYPH